MCTMLAHTCVVVVHMFMFPSCGSIVLQMTCNCSIAQKPVECFSDFQRVESVHYLSVVCHWVHPGMGRECIGVPRYVEKAVG